MTKIIKSKIIGKLGENICNAYHKQMTTIPNI